MINEFVYSGLDALQNSFDHAAKQVAQQQSRKFKKTCFKHILFFEINAHV